MKQLVQMWRYPRMVSWYLVTTVLFLLLRLPFIRATFIPYYLEFLPAIFLVPLVGVFWGPAGALGILTASLLGDWLYGFWGALSPYRAIGLFLCAYGSKRLWDFSVMHIGRRGGFSPRWGDTVRFLYVSLPGCCAAAAWPALGADLFRLYPFPYFVLLILLNNVVFTTVLGAAFYRIMAREMVPHFGCWREVMRLHPQPVFTGRGALCYTVGCIGACAAGIIAGGVAYNMWPTQAFVIGSSTGPLVILAVTPFMIMQLVSLFMVRPSGDAGEQ